MQITERRMAEKPRHIEFLDILRGVAALLVFLFHSVGASYGVAALPWKGFVKDFATLPGGPSFFAVYPATLGGLGVALFFVISGFCIHLSHCRAKQASWTGFFIRRFFRIYPPYLFALLLFAVVWPLTRFNNLRQLLDWKDFISHLFLVYNFDESSFFGINPSFWSIAVEAQLYLLYPILFLLAARTSWKIAFLVAAGIELVLHLNVIVIALGGQLPFISPLIAALPVPIVQLPFYSWGSWSLGALIAEAYLKDARLPLARFSFIGIVILTLIFSIFLPTNFLTFSLAAIASATLIAKWLTHLLAEPDQLPISNWFTDHLKSIGRVSYSFYLLHQPLLGSFVVLLRQTYPSAHPLVYFSLCIIPWFFIGWISQLSYHFIELPSIQLGKHVYQRMQRSSTQIRE